VERVHILLVEDNAGDTLLVQQALTSCLIPIKLHIARDGEQGLAMLAAADFAPSLIMLDLNMPRIGGFTFLQRYQPRDIPVVVFSVSPLETDKEFALELGANEFVQKPIELEAFKDVVCQMVVNWVEQKETSAVP
jgi:two-component system response regulator